MHEESTKLFRSQLKSLTGIRFLAALAVFFYHYGAGFSERVGMPEPLTTFLHNGNYGVSMFFVLSGFILTYTYDEKLSTKHELYNFYVARIARIYPVYLFILVVALPVLPHPIDTRGVVAVLLMLQSWTPASSLFGFTWVVQAWTLSIEMFFYAMFPLALVSCRGLKLRGIVAGLILAGVPIVAFGLPTVTPGTVGVPLLPDLPLPALRSFEFLFGMLICKLFFTAPQMAQAIARGWMTALTLAGIVVILSSSVNSHVTAVATILFGIQILQLAAGKNWIATALSTQTMVLLGGASYALYLIQSPMKGWLRLIISDEALVSAANPLAALLAAITIYLFIEQPMRRHVRAALMACMRWPVLNPAPVRKTPAVRVVQFEERRPEESNSSAAAKHSAGVDVSVNKTRVASSARRAKFSRRR